MIDAYLQIEGIKGESQDAAHKDWIECLNVHFEASKRDLGRPWLTSLLHRRPGIYDTRVPGRHRYKLHENFK